MNRIILSICLLGSISLQASQVNIKMAESSSSVSQQSEQVVDRFIFRYTREDVNWAAPFIILRYSLMCSRTQRSTEIVVIRDHSGFVRKMGNWSDSESLADAKVYEYLRMAMKKFCGVKHYKDVDDDKPSRIKVSFGISPSGGIIEEDEEKPAL